MGKYILGAVVFIVILVSCEPKKTALTAQQIVDKAIAVSGGDLYTTSTIDFTFRDRRYSSEPSGSQKTMQRLLKNDTIAILDIKSPNQFQRYRNDSLVVVSDSMANVYSNSINSVHYFAYLPYGLNDRAVKKELVGETKIKGQEYYKVRVTFDQLGGGKDFEDVYVYWFNKDTYKPDYLAYGFQVDGGGVRFREAYNERYVEGIRFVDYNNYKAARAISVMQLDSLFENDKLELLSKIALEEIAVSKAGTLK